MEALGRLAQKLASFPQAHAIKIQRLKRRRPWALRSVLVIGVIAAATGLLVETGPRPHSVSDKPETMAPGQLPPGDAKLIPDLADFRPAQPQDWDPGALAWMVAQHQTVESRLEGNFCGSDNRKDVAYLLVGPENTRRLVVLCQNENVYDTRYSYLGMIARIPQETQAAIRWSVKPSEKTETDGLLITISPDDPASGRILFVPDRRLVTGVPGNYQSLNLE